ncbi:MAG: response regulator [Leptolyngbya sp. SIO3F4]|nr:response regulator [Leptolyngbya sp. SIO3F4]
MTPTDDTPPNLSDTPAQTVSQSNPRQEQQSILIVDDNPNNVKVLCDLLSSHNYRISIAKSGKSALKKVSRSRPDLILLDIMMPDMDGFEVCTRMKADPDTTDIPILFMTALSDTVNKVKGLSLGAVDYITKPIEHEEALARIRVHLKLRQTQAQLLQEAKMAALGQLVAGIAHEINNPISFIFGNLEPAVIYTEALLELINLYESYTPSPPDEITAFAEEIEIDYIRKDFPRLLNSMVMGAERIDKIVRSLHTFSRTDELERRPVALHEGLDGTLMILQNRLKAQSKRPAIDVVKNYAPLPLVTCYPGKLNQVFMNLIVNAIDAIDDKCATLSEENLKTEEPSLGISTALVENQAVITIKDSGTGIPRNIQQRIFDQFFTTKPVGKGTGLGLAISYAIVTQDHQGELTFRSQEGVGTDFIVKLPLQG